MRSSNNRKKLTRPITILSLNVGRGASAHEIALNQAHQLLFDIILIQEPYIFLNLSRRIAKHHPSYGTFSPTDDWTINRPRVISYVRKGFGLRAEQVHSISNDIIILKLQSAKGKVLKIFNIFNAPYNTRGQSTIQLLYTLPRTYFN